MVSAAFDWDYFQRNPTVPNSRRRFTSYRLPSAQDNSIALVSGPASAFCVRNMGGKLGGQMRLRIALLATYMILAVSAGGCGSPGTLIVEQSVGAPPIQMTVPADCAYGLFIAGQSKPLVTLDMKQGDKLGFALTEGGTVGAMRIQWRCAVAGERYLHIDFNTSYQWRRL